MSRIRIYELAKELSGGTKKVSSKEIVERAAAMGIAVENHLSQLDETDALRLRKAFRDAAAVGDGTETKMRKTGRTIIRRRKPGTEGDGAGVDASAEGAPAAESAAPEVVADQVTDGAAPAPDLETVQASEQEGLAVEPGQPLPEAPAAVQEVAPSEQDLSEGTEEAAPEAAVEAPSEAVAAEALPAAADVPPAGQAAPPAGPVPEPLKLTPRRKKKDEYHAVVISMPEAEEIEKAKAAVAAPVVKPIPRISERDVEKDEKSSSPRKKGKRLIYDRRREGPPAAFGGDRDVMRGGRVRRKKAKGEATLDVAPAPGQRRVIRMEETITVSEMAAQMAVKANVLLKKLVEQGLMATVNDPLDFEMVQLLAADLGYEVESVAFDPARYLEVEADDPTKLASRPPVVTIMGHVDHGKTSLLDRIQATNIAAGEAGGITQRIGAYTVEVNKGRVTFIDTPGHEAFTAMRARGAMVTDIVILVVAADDGVMPQTVEAINHAKAAKVPLIVAVNKMDKPEADLERIRADLSKHELVPEDWGGTTIFVPVSARTGYGVPQLLELLVLQAQMMDLKSNPDKRAKGIIIESRLEKGRGPVATVIVQEGTLKVGDAVVAGTTSGRVRALTDDRGRPMASVGPGLPAEIVGLDKVPPASECLYAVTDDKVARMVSGHVDKKEREERLAKQRKPTFEQLFSQLGTEAKKTLKVVLKADAHGAVEAIAQGMRQMGGEQVTLEVIHQGVGVISEQDVNLARASDGFVLGFNVKPDVRAKAVADLAGVQVLTFSLIHELLDKTKLLMEGKLDLVETEVFLGRAEVRQVFTVSRVGKIAGSYVSEGKILRSGVAKLLRNGEQLWQGKLSSLKHFKDDVREVAQGLECGIGLDGYDGAEPGDVIEIYEIQRVAASL
jgi:translation initiation factor IF-2